jgi:ATP synthase H subunit
MADSSVEKLKRIKEAEEQARRILGEAGNEAEGLLAAAREKAKRGRAEAETRAGEDGNRELEKALEQAQEEARDIRGRTQEKVEKLKEPAGRKQEKAVAFLLQSLEQASE